MRWSRSTDKRGANGTETRGLLQDREKIGCNTRTRLPLHIFEEHYPWLYSLASPTGVGSTVEH